MTDFVIGFLKINKQDYNEFLVFHVISIIKCNKSSRSGQPLPSLAPACSVSGLYHRVKRQFRTFARYQTLGNALMNTRINSRVTNHIHAIGSSLNIPGGMLSTPVALLTFRPLIPLPTSISVIGLSKTGQFIWPC